ncbi:MAG TPA: aspartate aminotransferase family protein [Bacteroidales bacterium]|nr:aspartate aminotransferase family protein [Bacteroidales bacterium]
MNLFDVYPRYKINIVKSEGIFLWDDQNRKYLDLYGGHGVISIGHAHPAYLLAIQKQIEKIGFYSNSVEMPIQQDLATKLGEQSGYNDYNLFLCNSGAEANENALKLASFHNGKKKIIAFKNSFHGRTAAAVHVTDDQKLSAPLNKEQFEVEFLELNQSEALIKALNDPNIAAVIFEGIQGVGGLDMPSEEYLQLLAKLCKEKNIVLIADEIQSGYGRSGHFFAHQSAGIKADIISIAKGMGNGFPIGGLLINPEIESKHGMLGTTFGGNHLACAAAISVLNTLQNEDLIQHAKKIGQQLSDELSKLPKIKKLKGKGLMLGIEFDFPAKSIREELLFDYGIFTGSSANANLLRILPPLTIQFDDLKPFLFALNEILTK